MKTCKEYRVQAKEILKGNWAIAIGAFVVMGLIISVLTTTVVGGIVLTGAMLVGYSRMQMNLIRTGKIEFTDMFSGFAKNSEHFGSTIGLYLETAIFVFLWSLLFCIPGIIASYSYSMAQYILADHPEMRGIDAIRASKEVMKGKKGKLFLLELSYIGWCLLCVLTFGILTLWVTPWMETARAAFYEDLKDEVNVVSQ